MAGFEQRDPYDVTGAHALYARLLNEGVTEEEAREKAERFAQAVPASYISTATKQVDTYLTWCDKWNMPPCELKSLTGFSGENVRRNGGTSTAVLHENNWRAVRRAMNVRAEKGSGELPDEVTQILLEAQFTSSTAVRSSRGGRLRMYTYATGGLMVALIGGAFLLSASLFGGQSAPVTTLDPLPCPLVAPGPVPEFFGTTPESAVATLAATTSPDTETVFGPDGVVHMFVNGAPYGVVTVVEAREQSTFDDPFKGSEPRYSARVTEVCQTM